MDSLQLATTYLQSDLQGRYITNEDILPLIKLLNNRFKINLEGKSVLDKPIYSVRFGIGKIKVFAWSQMHGNESTTTKALFDFFNYLASNETLAENWYTSFTFLSIPILNPDGAVAYTRVNANQIDLNRDAFDITQPESKLLRRIYEEFEPDYCFNLHDQRTIFGTEMNDLPASVSFLAPAFDETRAFNETRHKAIAIINAMNSNLASFIPNQIGRFDDSFNINCIGDYLTYRNTPTILFEAGHYKEDYQRDEVRKFIFCALWSGFQAINENVIVSNNLEDYLNISQNSKCFYDFLYKNVRIIDNSQEKLINFAAQFTEILKDGAIHFEAYIVQIENLEGYVGHYEFDAEGGVFNANYGNKPKLGEKANFSIDDRIKFINGIQYQQL
ncbi:peptidase M14 [Flavobacterium sp. TP390]|uniref:Peptidase M14 n=1 Tax=Flavobacterium profundi TaxID=1774945 RepID=A0A6I4IFG9_9FLAO|nr:M14 family zinc carboxypeptidase [Flavobacterium profundi]MVO08348.1 peptidase M14 [Flavobacterium profundi]